MVLCINCNHSVITLDYNSATIYLCNNCGLGKAVRKNKYINYESNLSYNINYYMSKKSININYYKPYNDFFKFIRKSFYYKKIKILDIGCGNGLFLQACLNKGFDITGIEINKNFKEVVPLEISKHIIYEDISQITDFDSEFDIITFWDSFEHIENSFEVLHFLRKYLKKDGIIYLRVNNNKDVFNIISLLLLKIFPYIGKKVYASCFHIPHHVWNFSFKSMYDLLFKNEWKITHFCFSDTPPSRLTNNYLFKCLIHLFYIINRIISGGKIGNYYIKKI